MLGYSALEIPGLSGLRYSPLREVCMAILHRLFICRLFATGRRHCGRILLPFSLSFFLVFLLVSNPSYSLECPKQPEQVSKDWEVEVNAAVAKIGPVSGGELKNKTRNVTQDLLGKLPDAGRIYLQQMMFSSYCTSLRDDKTISEAEKAARLKDYISEVQRVMNPQLSIPTAKPSNQASVPKHNIAPNIKRFGLTLGWQLGRYEMLYQSPIPEAAAAAPDLEREIQTMLEQDHYPNAVQSVSAQQLMHDVLLYYGSADADKHAMILLGMAAVRAMMAGASNDQSINEQMAELAHGMIAEIDSTVLPNKERIFQALLRQKPKNIPAVIQLVNNTP
jgi:hypothetical protein